jgi:hypothetical protein
LRHAEAAQARRARRDRDGEIQGEEGLAALRLPADDADGIGRPQIGDQPALLVKADRQCKGPFDGQRVQRRRPAALFTCAGEGTV